MGMVDAEMVSGRERTTLRGFSHEAQRWMVKNMTGVKYGGMIRIDNDAAPEILKMMLDAGLKVKVW